MISHKTKQSYDFPGKRPTLVKRGVIPGEMGGGQCVLGAGPGRGCPAHVVPPMQKDARQTLICFLLFPVTFSSATSSH